LALSVRERGIEQPLSVRDLGDGQYLLVDGRQRLASAIAAGQTVVPVICGSYQDAQDAFLAQIEENIHRPWSHLELARIARRLQGGFGWTQVQVAGYLSEHFKQLSRVQVAQLLALLDLGAAAQGLLSSGAISYGVARELCRLNAEPACQAAAVASIQDWLADGAAVETRAVAALVTRLLEPPAARATRTLVAAAQAGRDSAPAAALAQPVASSPLAMRDTEGTILAAAIAGVTAALDCPALRGRRGWQALRDVCQLALEAEVADD